MILFLAFSFVQFISRWESDSEIARAPWQIYVMGDSKKTPMKSSSPIVFSKRATAYGTPTSKITDSYIYSTDRQEIFIILNAISILLGMESSSNLFHTKAMNSIFS